MKKKRESIIKGKYKLFRFNTEDGLYGDFIYKVLKHIEDVDINNNNKYTHINKVCNMVGASKIAIEKHINTMYDEFLNSGMALNTKKEIMFSEKSISLLKMTFDDYNFSENMRSQILDSIDS